MEAYSGSFSRITRPRPSLAYSPLPKSVISISSPGFADEQQAPPEFAGVTVVPMPMLQGQDPKIRVAPKDVKTAGRSQMPIRKAAAMLKKAHVEMAERNAAGEYYLAMAITQGDPDKRTPARFWIFGYGPKTELRWITYPRSLPGVYFKTTIQSVNGHFPESYLSENGDMISMKTEKDLRMPANTTLVALGSTTVNCQVSDDLGNIEDFTLSPPSGEEAAEKITPPSAPSAH